MNYFRSNRSFRPYHKIYSFNKFHSLSQFYSLYPSDTSYPYNLLYKLNEPIISGRFISTKSTFNPSAFNTIDVRRYFSSSF